MKTVACACMQLSAHAQQTRELTGERCARHAADAAHHGEQAERVGESLHAHEIDEYDRRE